MQEEIFGPVVGFTKGDNFEELLEIANDTDYGLTGAVITNNREHWRQACEDYDVGNLYFNFIKLFFINDRSHVYIRTAFCMIN